MRDFDVAASIRRIRAIDHRAVLMVRSQVPAGVEVVLALDAGADGCVDAAEELTIVEARLRRALQRRHACDACGRHARQRVARYQGGDEDLADELSLTRIEERLWRALRSCPGELVPAEHLVARLWKRPESDLKLLYEHVSTLRAKLGTTDWTITNVRGKGYRLDQSSGRTFRVVR